MEEKSVVEFNKNKARGPRSVLNLREDYELTDWMHTRTPTWGESAPEIFEQAKIALPHIDKLNVDHIKTRLAAFIETLPKAAPPVRELSFYERIDRLENLLSILCKDRIDNSATSADLAVMDGFWREIKVE